MPRWITYLKQDPLLLGLVIACVLLLCFQLFVLLLRPPWLEPVTDWLRAVLAWPELLVLVVVSAWLSRRHRLEAVSWWFFSGAALCYAIARTWWALDDVLIFPHGAPFPSGPDLVFVLQYPFYFLAVMFIPFGAYFGSRLMAILDALILLLAATAISWYFLLEPLFAANGLSPLARAEGVGYPVADVFLFLALILMLVRPLRYSADRPVVGLICVAVACLIIADVGAIFLILHPSYEMHSGSLSDFFWLADDLLLPLAAVLQVRVVQRMPAGAAEAPEQRLGQGQDRAQRRSGLSDEDIRAALSLFLPLIVALLASGAILLRASSEAAPNADWRQLAARIAVITCLLLLVIVRQAIMFLELAQLRSLDRRKDEFLSVMSHELRTPLSVLELFFAHLEHQLDTLLPRGASTEQGTTAATATATAATISPAHSPESRHTADPTALRTALAYAQANIQRLVRLANDLEDDTRVRRGRLTVRRAPCDLRTIVQATVAEQRALEPGRAISLELPDGDQPVPVFADADRIAQVLTNFLTNAVKYSTQERPVTLRLEVVHGRGMEDAERRLDTPRGRNGELARVSVQDEGIGVPLGEQQQIWNRFHVVEGNRIQSGSGISLGLGLHLCKAIMEEHHGHVGLDSIPGKGSTFWFTLPLAPSAAS